MKLRTWLLAGVATLLLLLGLAGYAVLAWPADVVNFLARQLHIDITIDALDYDLSDGRILLHLKEISYRRSTPELQLALDQAVIDVGIDLGRKEIGIEALTLRGLQASVVQHGTVPWWQQFGSEQSAERETPKGGSDWTLRVGAIDWRDIALSIELLEQRRQYALNIADFSSERSAEGVRRLEINGAINGEPLHIEGASLVNVNLIDRQAPFSVTLNVDLAGLILQADGQIGLVEDREETEVTVNIDVATLPEFARTFDIELPAIEQASAHAVIRDSVQGYRLDDLDVRWRTPNISLSVQGDILRPLQQWQPDLAIDVSIVSLQDLLAEFDVAMGIDFSVDVQGQLQRPDQFLELSGANGGITLEGWEVPYGQQFGLRDARVRLPKDDIAGWAGPFELPLMVLGGEAIIAMAFADELLYYDIPLREVGMAIRGDGMDLQGKASFKALPIDVDFMMDEQWDVLAGSVHARAADLSLGMNFSKDYLPFDIDINLSDAQALNRWLRVSLPEHTAIEASGSLRLGENYAVSLHDFNVLAEHGGYAALHLPRYRLAAPTVLAGQIRMAIPQVSEFQPLADEVVDYVNRDRWRHLMWDLSTRTADVERADNGLLPFNVGEALERWPALDGRLNLRTRLDWQGADLMLEDLVMRFVGRDFVFGVDGTLGKLGADPRVAIAFDATVVNGAFFDWPEPLKVAGDFQTNGDVIRAQRVRLQSDKSEMLLHLQIEDAFAPRPRLIAQASADYWHVLRSRGTARDAGDPVAEEAGTRQHAQHDKKSVKKGTKKGPKGHAKQHEAPERYFSVEPIDLGILDKFDALLRIDVGELDFDAYTIEDLQAQLRLRDGKLVIDPVKMMVLDGMLIGTFSRSPLATEGSDWSIDLYAEDVNLGAYHGAPQNPHQGLLSGRAELTSRGQSWHDIMVNLTGRVTQTAHDMVIYGFDIDKLAPDILLNTLRQISPFTSWEQQVVKSEIECQYAHLVFGDGLMAVDKPILLRTPQSLFEVDWLVDFETERQRLRFVPRAREGMSLAATDFAKMLQVGGTLLEPRLEVDAAGMLAMGAGSAALIASGGWLVWLGWRELANVGGADDCEALGSEYMRTPTDAVNLPRRKQ